MSADSPQPPESLVSPTPDGRPSARRDPNAIRIAVIAGIPIRLHITFLFLLVWLAVGGLSDGAGGRAAPLENLLFVAGIFFCVVLHELGHALVALRYGVRTRDIILYPIGGIASLETQPAPKQELWIALAGPAVNLIIAALIGLGLKSAGHFPANQAAWMRESKNPHILISLFSANIMLCLFNMIPAFPMDGGRVLRALLARTTDDLTATVLAARVGQGIALVFGLIALFAGQPFLGLIALFVFWAAGQEAGAYQSRALLTGHRVREAMMREFRTLSVGNSLREASDALLLGSQQDFPVLNGEEVVGALSRSDLMRALATEGQDAYVAGAMTRDFAWADPDDDLVSLLMKTQTSPRGPILVLAGGKREDSALVGMLTQENLLEFLTLAQIRNSQSNPSLR